MKLLPLLLLATSALAQISSTASSDDGYIGYSLTERGDSESVLYETEDTIAGDATTQPPPDVFLNASVSIGEIDIDVQNLTAQINLAAEVLNLLSFNAGVDVSVNRVDLQIQNVTAKVLLEARLGNLVAMISSVMDSLDLNPVLATLGNDVSNIVNTTVGAVSGAAAALTKREDAESYNIAHNILYSINDYSGNTHTNRILTQTGSIVDQSLDNDGNVVGEKVVGDYSTSMSANGFSKTVMYGGQEVTESQYNYMPLPGVIAIAAVFVDAQGEVVGAQVLSELFAGGESTISADL
jgi:hypothetical protein